MAPFCFFTNETSIYRKESGAFLEDALSLGVPPLLDHLGLAVCEASAQSLLSHPSLLGERGRKRERLHPSAFIFVKFRMSHVNSVMNFYLLKSRPKVMIPQQHILSASLGIS